MIRKIEVRPGFLALVCILAWVSREVCLCFLLGAAVHELGHLLAMVAMKISVHKIILGAPGACISCGHCSYRQEILCALAGPAANMLLSLCVLRVEADLAMISGILGVFNLLPLYPLDGGRVLRAALRCVTEEEQAERIAGQVTFMLSLLLMIVACSLTVWLQMGIWPIFGAVAVLWKAGTAKGSTR